MVGIPVSTLKTLEKQIRAGQASLAAEKLESLAKKKLTRPERLVLASLSYRAGVASLGLRLLHSRVRPKVDWRSTANDNERAVYAQCLERVGANEEAMALLREVDTVLAPRGLFFRALAYMAQWDYAAAVPPLEAYLRAARLDAYQKLVAKLNLSACYAAGARTVQAMTLIREVLYRTSLGKLPLLHANALEVYAQCCYTRKNWDGALRCLSKAEEILRQTGTIDALWVMKWRAVVALSSEGPTPAALSLMARVKERAEESRASEVFRDCDAHEAIALKDSARFWKVYFGTPFEAYRAGLLRRYPEAGVPPDSYRWSPALTSASEEVTLDLKTGFVPTASRALKPGQLPHRLLLALCQDLYRPVRNAALFTRLYPGDFYRPSSGPARVHETVKRFRRWLSENHVPLSVEEEDGAYRLVFRGSVGILIPREHPLGEIAQPPAERLRQRWSGVGFSSADAATLLEISKRSVQRLLETMVADGTLVRKGATTACRYWFRE